MADDPVNLAEEYAYKEWKKLGLPRRALQDLLVAYRTGRLRDDGSERHKRIAEVLRKFDAGEYGDE